MMVHFWALQHLPLSLCQNPLRQHCMSLRWVSRCFANPRRIFISLLANIDGVSVMQSSRPNTSRNANRLVTHVTW